MRPLSDLFSREIKAKTGKSALASAVAAVPGEAGNRAFSDVLGDFIQSAFCSTGPPHLRRLARGSTRPPSRHRLLAPARGRGAAFDRSEAGQARLICRAVAGLTRLTNSLRLLVEIVAKACLKPDLGRFIGNRPLSVIW